MEHWQRSILKLVKKKGPPYEGTTKVMNFGAPFSDPPPRTFGAPKGPPPVSSMFREPNTRTALRKPTLNLVNFGCIFEGLKCHGLHLFFGGVLRFVEQIFTQN